MRHRPHCLVAATCSVRTLSCLSHAPTPLPPRSAPMSRAMTHAPLSCISWSLQVHSLSLGNLLQDPLTAAHRSDGRSWSAIGVSLQLGEGPAALGLLLVLGMRALPTCGCRRGRRVLLLVGCHCPASEFLPRAASELGGLVLLVRTGLGCSSRVPQDAPGRWSATAQSSTRSAARGAPMSASPCSPSPTRNSTGQRSPWRSASSAGRCRAVSAGDGHRAAKLHFQRTCSLLKFLTSGKKKEVKVSTYSLKVTQNDGYC